MDNPVISVKELSKMYKVYNSPADMVLELLLGRTRHREFWALKNVSFDIGKGEVVGLIGTNGAGKSTLLKLLAGTIDKTGGDYSISGRISAILELGTGFHPEYTGRENIYMGGLCLGMSKKEVEEKMESIIEFSGVRNFIDNPLRTYSSGMSARLAFSLAVSQTPEVLIVDEALATGDAIFVEKCLRKIKEICSRNTTVLFVSHSLETLHMFCKRGIWLHQGSVVYDGDIDTVIKAYRRFTLEQSDGFAGSYSTSTEGLNRAQDLIDLSQSKKITLSADSEFFKYGNKSVVIKKFEVRDLKGKPRSQFISEEGLEFKIDYEGDWDQSWELHAGCRIFNNLGGLVFTPATIFEKTPVSKPQLKKGSFTISFPRLYLGPGEYFLTPVLLLVKGDEHKYADYHDKLYKIAVLSSKYRDTYLFELPVEISMKGSDV